MLGPKCYWQRCWNEECCKTRFEAYRKNETTTDERKGGGGGEEEEGDDEDASNKLASKGYEDNAYVSSCKAPTRQFSMDIWEIVNDFLVIYKSMYALYVRFRKGETIEGMEDMNKCEDMEDVDLSGDDGEMEQQPYAPTYPSREEVRKIYGNDSDLDELFSMSSSSSS
jgi:hypothetical protein